MRVMRHLRPLILHLSTASKLAVKQHMQTASFESFEEWLAEDVFSLKLGEVSQASQVHAAHDVPINVRYLTWPAKLHHLLDLAVSR